MNFSKINELKPYDLNCNIFDVYSYDGLSMQELLCQFFTKINECIKTSNETIDLAEWLVNEGLKQEVVIKLTNWLNDGTIENLINVTLFENLNKKIDNVSSQLEDKVNKLKNVYHVEDYRDNRSDTELLNFISEIVTNNSIIILDKDNYILNDTIYFKNKSNISIKGNVDITENILPNKSVLYFKNCDNINISNLKCNGSEKLEGFFGSADDDFSFIYFDDCINCNIKNISINNKTYGIILNKCENVKITNTRVYGFLLSGSLTENGSNYNASIYVKKSKNIYIEGLKCRDIGQGVSVGLDSKYIEMKNIIIENARDNGIYVSSGENCVLSNIKVNGCNSSGIKVRGKNHVLESCFINDSYIGISLTGNGSTTDSNGFNGGYSIVNNCIIDNCSDIGIDIGVQDDLYGCSYTVKNNTIKNVQSILTNRAFIRVTKSDNTNIIGNTLIGDVIGEYSILITGEVKNMNISNNVIKTKSKNGIRLNSLNNSIISYNVIENSIGVDGRYVNNCLIEGNICPEGTVFNLSSSYNSENNILTKNIGNNLNCDYGKNILQYNTPTIKNVYGGITSIPKYPGQITVVSGKIYIAKGVATVDDWVLIE